MTTLNQNPDAAKASAPPTRPFRSFFMSGERDDPRLLIDLRETEFPLVIGTYGDASYNTDRMGEIFERIDGEDVTYYGMVIGGMVGILSDPDMEMVETCDPESALVMGVMRPGSYFVQPAPLALSAIDPSSRVLLIGRVGYRGLRVIGGPVEPVGRLRYIDGCSDTLLVCPPVLGEPCLNLLHIPAGIDQTAHTHPSERIGVILSGRGYCLAENEHGDMIRHELVPGLVWHIPTGVRHSFHTEDSALDVMAFHPDSTFGPAHDDHPMLTRSYVEGTSAKDIAAIRTEAITQ